MKASEDHVPHIIQIESHAGELYALNDHGELFMRARDAKDFNQGPLGKPLYVWHRIPGPDAPLE